MKMDQELKEYIASLIPKDFPDGNALVQEGRELAKEIPWNKSRFLKEYGYKSHLEYRKKNLAEGKAVVSLGMADFIPGHDPDVDTVFERDDAEMYERKNVLMRMGAGGR